MSGLQIVAHRLNNNQAVSALVPQNRQCLVVAPQDVVPPYIVMSQVSGVDQVLLGGQGDFPMERIQIDCMAADYNTAKSIAKLVRGALVNTINLTIMQGTALRVKNVSITASGDERTDYFDSLSMRIVSSDYRVRWRYL